MSEMTQEEFYIAVSKLGKQAHCDESIMWKDGELFYYYIGISVDGIAINSAHSYEEALEWFNSIDRDAIKNDKIASLKMQLAELDS